MRAGKQFFGIKISGIKLKLALGEVSGITRRKLRNVITNPLLPFQKKLPLYIMKAVLPPPVAAIAAPEEETMPIGALEPAERAGRKETKN